MINKNENSEKKILVLGGTGKTGSRVAKRLIQKDLPIRIGSRTAKPNFDWEDSSTWNAALRDIKSIYITFQPDLAALVQLK